MKDNRFKSFAGLMFMGGFLFISSCRPEPLEVDFSFIIDSYSLSVPEPSGLAYSVDKESFFVVSDRGKLYQISLTGTIIRELPYIGNDTEGVTVDPITANIYVCEEGRGDLVKLNSSGVMIDSYNLLDNPGNSGLEGLTYNIELNEFYLLKEKDDGILIKYSIEDDLTTIINLNFSSDYSGIFYNESSRKLWIVSEEERTLTQCNLNGSVIKSYSFPINGIEGIVVNDDETVAYVVSDPNSKLYKLDLTIN